MGPPTALQKPGGMDGGRSRRGNGTEGCGVLRKWHGSFRGDGRKLLEGCCGLSGLCFIDDCHLTETVNTNCFLNAADKEERKYSSKDHRYFLQRQRMDAIHF